MTIARDLLAAAAALACLCTGSADAAPADPVVAEAIHALDALCGASGGRQIDVISAAEADGYLPAGPELTTGMVQSGDMSSVARIKRVGKTVIYLVAMAPQSMGRDAPMPGAMADTCMVLIRTAVPGLADAVQGWATVPAIPGEKNSYGFLEAPEGRKSVIDVSEEEGLAATKAGQVRMIKVETGKTLSGITYVAIRPKVGAQAPGAPAGPLADFLEICVKDDGAGAEAAAQAGRWMFAPGGEDLPWPFKSGDTRVRSTEDDFKTLMLGRAQTQLALTVVDMPVFCAIGQVPPNGTVLLKDAEDWIGVTPVEVDPGGSRIYLFTVRNGVHESLGVKWEKTISARLKAGPVYFAQIQRSGSSGDFAVAAIGRVTKATKL